MKAVTGTIPIVTGSCRCRQRKEGVMHLHTFRDENHSRHFDLIGHNWSIDLVAVTAAGVLVVGFACAVVALLVH